MKILNLSLIVTMLFAITSASYAVERDVSELQFNTNGWVWIPTTLDDRVDSFVGLRTNEVIGENITAVWIQRTEDLSWESWGWSDQDQSKAIASVKSILDLPDSTDAKWPITLSTEPVEEPEKLTKGVLESDPFSTTVQVLPDPELFVLSLETVGWKTAWLDIWNFECEDFVVLSTWAMAVDATKYESDLNSGTSNLIQTTFENTVSKPCGTDPCIRQVDPQDLQLIIAVDIPGSVFATGLFYDETGSTVFLENIEVVPGQEMVSGSLVNTGVMTTSVFTDNGTIIVIQPNEQVVVEDTYDTCWWQCRRIIGYDMTNMGSRIPIYGVDSRCYCCCWASLQPDPPVWQTTLPDCPCNVTLDEDGNPFDENGDPLNDWDVETPYQKYHPGESFCLRTCPAIDGGPGQQCCYDASGDLITVGGGAGTPDAIAPCGLWDWWSHMEEDVYSFDYCKSAGMLNCYLKHRTPNNGNNCDCRPVDHDDCTHEVIAYSCNCD